MWKTIALFILRFRLFFIIFIFLITGLMGYFASQVQMSYNFASLVPDYDEEMIYFKRFKQIFGEDANILAIGMKDDKVFQLKNFEALRELTDKVSKMEGVTQVLSLPRMQYLAKDTAAKKFIAKAIFPKSIGNQQQLDSLLKFAKNLKFYQNQLINVENGANILLISIRKDVLDAKIRHQLMDGIIEAGDAFTAKTGVALHYAGVPVVRTVMTQKMSKEIQLLLGLSLLMTAIILYIFFRSLKSVIIPLLVICILIIWTLGTIYLFGYKVSIVLALLPPILVVIGIPNCVYLLNKYHQEYRLLGDKMKALEEVLQRISVVALMTNATTAVGFFVFLLMDSRVLREFGWVSGLMIMAAYVVSLVMMPALLAYMPAPKPRELKHLDRSSLDFSLKTYHNLVFKHRTVTYIVTLLIVVVSVIGLLQIKVVSFMVDDIPAESVTRKDLAFFEKNFKGIMPLEIVIDTGKEKGVMKASTLKLVEKYEQELSKIPLISVPISVIGFVKATRQAYYNNLPEFYEMPSNQDRPFVLNYLQNSQGEDSTGLMRAFVDSTGRELRISLKVADIGSLRMDSLVNKAIAPISARVFKDSGIKAHITGTTLIFIKGNEYLVTNLQQSIVMAIFIIGILIAILFSRWRIVIVSILTNMIPLLITAGLMGYLGVPLKPSTALIFSVTFGIAVDDAIHYLARYRMVFRENENVSISEAVALALKETGGGMMYTSIILFFGFIVFVASEFEGTRALGLLTSTTLICAMFGNLIVLPALLVSFDKKGKTTKE
ncbi:MAG: hypothetical protein EAZ55_14430 [Cytophagales bacterium]|nr:MAG: hypothetical protein EAZ55_14430 [Cytophagales bacterium]